MTMDSPQWRLPTFIYILLETKSYESSEFCFYIIRGNLLYWPRNKTIDHLNQKRLSLTLDHCQEKKRPSK